MIPVFGKIIVLFWAVLAFARSPFAGNAASSVLVKELSTHQISCLLKDIGQTPHADVGPSALVSFDTLNGLIKTFVAQQEQILLGENWVKKQQKMPDAFVQKIIIPVDARIVTMGDLHGDSNSLDDLIQYWRKPTAGRPALLDKQLRVRDEKTYIVGLGDYVDRGNGGAEIWALLAQLKAANPNHVFLLRGNHENRRINASYGFLEELCCKYGSREAVALMDQFDRAYCCLPSALLVEIQSNTMKRDCVLFCHGGVEIGVDLRPLLSSSTARCQAIDVINRLSRWAQVFAANLSGEYMYTPTPKEGCFGLEWGDFCINGERISYQGGRGLKADKVLTRAWLDHMSVSECHVRAIVRAHQHGNDEDVALLVKNGGVYQLWDKMVTTVISCMPLVCRMRKLDNVRTAFMTLHVAPQFDQWRYESQCVPVEKN